MIPYLYGGGAHPGAAASGSLVLPANGGAVAIPLLVNDRMIAASITAHTADTSGTHTLETALCPDGMINGLPSMSVAGIGSFTYTNGAAAVRTGNIGDIELWPGLWWLVVRNASAVTTALGRVAPGTLAGSVAATATLASTFGESLAGVPWVKTNSLPLVRVNGIIEAVPGTVFN